MYTCTCCSPSKSYTELRNLYRHQRKYDPNFIEPKDRAELAYESNPTLCLNCETTLTRQQVIDGNGSAKYCSRKCSRQHSGSGRPLKYGPNKPPIERNSVTMKPCNHCGDGFKAYRQQKYCSPVCSRSAQSSSIVEQWLAGTLDGHSGGGALRPTIRRYLIEQANHKCSQCGWGEINPTTGKSPLNVDHIDGNSLNNHPDNLRVLCPNCHSLTPTYGALNIGNGRDSLRKEKRKAWREKLKE